MSAGGRISRWRFAHKVGTALSTVALVAVVVLWWRADRGDALQLLAVGGFDLRTSPDGIHVARYSGWPGPPAPGYERRTYEFHMRWVGGLNGKWLFHRIGESPTLSRPIAVVRGFTDLTYLPTETKTRVHWIEFVCPFWIAWIAVAVLPGWSVVQALAVRRRERKIRKSGGMPCVLCGYDLRGTRGPCPECGRVVPAPVGADQ